MQKLRGECEEWLPPPMAIAANGRRTTPGRSRGRTGFGWRETECPDPADFAAPV